MAVPFGGSFSVLVLALAAILAGAQPAAAENGGAIALEAPNPCAAGHRFEPGPIMEGHNRQPTVREFQARMQELRQLEQRDAARCGSEVITQPSSAG